MHTGHISGVLEYWGRVVGCVLAQSGNPNHCHGMWSGNSVWATRSVAKTFHRQCNGDHIPSRRPSSCTKLAGYTYSGPQGSHQIGMMQHPDLVVSDHIPFEQLPFTQPGFPDQF